MGDLLARSDLPRLGSLLWDYRSAFDRLHFLLETQLLLIGNGRDDQLHHMVDLLGAANVRVNRLDLEREILLGVGADGAQIRLSELVAEVESPWDEILSEHESAMASMVAKTEDLVRRNATLIRRVRADLPDLETLLSASTVGGSTATVHLGAATYGRSGRNDDGGSGQAFLFEDRI